MKKIFCIFIISILSPGFIFAQSLETSSFKELLISSVEVISKQLLPLLVAIALVFFVIWIIYFIKHGDEPEIRKKWRQIFIWGIIALFLIIAILGILNALSRTFSGNNSSAVLPQLPTRESL